MIGLFLALINLFHLILPDNMGIGPLERRHEHQNHIKPFYTWSKMSKITVAPLLFITSTPSHTHTLSTPPPPKIHTWAHTHNEWGIISNILRAEDFGFFVHIYFLSLGVGALI